jgi:hypothetical protein
MTPRALRMKPPRQGRGKVLFTSTACGYLVGDPDRPSDFPALADDFPSLRIRRRHCPHDSHRRHPYGLRAGSGTGPEREPVDHPPADRSNPRRSAIRADGDSAISSGSTGAGQPVRPWPHERSSLESGSCPRGRSGRAGLLERVPGRISRSGPRRARARTSRPGASRAQGRGEPPADRPPRRRTRRAS